MKNDGRMDAIQISAMAMLAEKWKQQADSDMVVASAETRAAVRACSEALSMLCEVLRDDRQQQADG